MTYFFTFVVTTLWLSFSIIIIQIFLYFVKCNIFLIKICALRRRSVSEGKEGMRLFMKNVAIFGSSRSGKSTLAKMISKKYSNYHIIIGDDIRGAFQEVLPNNNKQ